MKTIALLPVDTTGLPSGPDVPPMPTPSIAHTLYPCDGCSRTCWIGPMQLAVLVAEKHPALCYFCVFSMMKRGADLGEPVGLNPHADELPRRT